MAAAVLGAAASPAAAQEQVAEPMGEVPGCALLDRADGVNRAGVELGYTMFDSPAGVDFTALRIDLHGQWLMPMGVGRAGGYAILPVSYARIDPDMGATNAEWVIGDAELGGVYRQRLSSELDVAAHLGVTLPTAPEGSLSATEISGFANGFAIYARPNDLVHAVPESSYLRLGVSPMLRSGQFFARADVAVDVPVHSANDEDLPTIGRLNGAAGVQASSMAFLFELVNLINLEEPETEDEDRWLTFAGVTARYTDGPWQPSLTLLLPLDDDIREAVDMVLIAGVQALLP
jgi:hypothetical protein